MKVYRLDSVKDKKAILKKLGVHGSGISIIADKMKLEYIYLSNVKTPALNILKQDALSIGADVAVPNGVITCAEDCYDAILVANHKQLKILAKKELAQPFGLKSLAKELHRFTSTKIYPTKIMAVINANDDSFYSASRFQGEDALRQIDKKIAEGADIIDIGAVSSRPGSATVDMQEELNRIKPICDAIKKKQYKDTLLSIDSYEPSVVEYALKSGFSIINDITGARDERLIELAIKYGAKICIMHMQGTPKSMQESPEYDDIMLEVSEFFEDRINKCKMMGLGLDDIILDVGIGFGKTLEHNLILLANMSHFTTFGCELLVGASRKSMIDHIIPTPIEHRLAGTLAIHLKAIESGANIIRCHDVADHKQAITVHNAIRSK